MSLNAATIEILISKGLSAADILDVARATETKADPTNAARQARSRAKKRNAVTVTEMPPYEVSSTPPEDLDTGEASPHSARAPAQPVAEAQSAWNEAAPASGWPAVGKLNSTRSRSLSARLREHGIEGWRAALGRAQQSPYLGRDPPSWFTFDWLIKPTNFLKLIEGNYDRRHDENRGAGGRMVAPGASSVLQIREAAAAAERQEREDRERPWPALPAAQHH